MPVHSIMVTFLVIFSVQALFLEHGAVAMPLSLMEGLCWPALLLGDFIHL